MYISEQKRRPFFKPSLEKMGKIGKTCDYVPLLSIRRLIIGNSYHFSSLSSKDRLLHTLLIEELVDKADYDIDRPLEQLLTTEFRKIKLDSSFDRNKTLKKCTKFFYDKLNYFINDDDLHFEIKGPESCYNASYNDVIERTKYLNSWSRTKIRSGDYLSNLWFLGFIPKESIRGSSSNGYKTLFSVMLKREMIPYVRMCFLMGEEPHPDVLELWIRDDLDIPKGPYKNLRSRYRKHFKKEIVDSGIKIVEMPCLDEVLFHKIKVPKFKSISEKNKWIKERSREFLDSLLRLELPINLTY